MRRSVGIAVAWAIGIAAVLGPIFVSVHLARTLSLTVEFNRLGVYAQDALRHAETTARQQTHASVTLERAHLPPCSPQEIALMRQLAITSDYLEAVGRVSGNQLLCSSLDNNQPLDLGPVDFSFRAGTSLRTGVRLPMAGGQPFMVAERDGFASFIAPSVPIDVPNVPSVTVALFSASTGRLVTSDGPVPANWRSLAHNAFRADFVDGGNLVSVVRSSRFDLDAVVSAPRTIVDTTVRRFAYFFVPIGILCGLALAGAVWYLTSIPLSMPGLLRAAARRNEFFVEYQPVVELPSGRWIGAEALVRWRRGREVVRPDAFISIAEESGVISLITERVLAHVAADLPEMQAIYPNFSVNVNLSARDLQSPVTLDLLRHTLEASGAAPSNLVIEISERGLLEGTSSFQIISEIRDLGIPVAIDDFGTGYSSLSRLGGLNVTHLKIDKTFVEAIGTDSPTTLVVPLVIEMAHTLKLKIVAEGVETEEQAAFLAARGVTLAQGWLFSRPMALQALLNRMKAAVQAPSTAMPPL
ncbi:MAG: EAL domain-containing protein [Acidobacteriaceae bacterium]